MGVRIREKKPGEWWVFINHNGKRWSKKIGADDALAREIAKKTEARLVLSDFGFEQEKKTAPTFGKCCQLWLEGYVKQTRRATTYNLYYGLFRNYINPKLGKIPIDHIRRGDVRACLLAIHTAGLSKSTISSARNVISGTLEFAIDDELVNTNNARGVLRKLGLDSHEGRNPVRPLTPEEVSHLLETCRQTQPKWYPLFLTAFRTGMRLGEILGLEWGDVDFRSRFILVQRSFRSGRLTKTKTSKARRVDMSDQLHNELRGLLTRRKEEALKAGRNEPEEIVFHTAGAHTSQNSVRNVWKRLLKKAGLVDRRIHDTRHTFASILLSAGVSPAYVKEQLGHASIQMTVDIYGHLIPGSNREAVNRLDSPHLSAPQPHPAKTEKPQPFEIATNS